MSDPIGVRILDREYLIACSADERAGLVAAAAYLDGKLRELRDSHRSGGLDRVAVLAALNMAHELLELRQQQSSNSTHLAQHLQVIKSKLEAGLPISLQ